VFEEGRITLGILLELFPFEDIMVVIEATGEQIWEALENGVSQFPKQEGRFPQVSGLKFTFDPSKPAGIRVSNVLILHNDDELGEYKPIDLKRTYKLATKTYLAQGKDGFVCFKDCKYLIPEESGLLLSSMIRIHWIKKAVVSRWTPKVQHHAKEKFLKAIASPKSKKLGDDVHFLAKIHATIEGRIIQTKLT
jgi:5'-nucleotidase